jgi:hypothetical protein
LAFRIAAQNHIQIGGRQFLNRSRRVPAPTRRGAIATPSCRPTWRGLFFFFAGNGSISIDVLLAANRLVEEVGGIERAKEAIEVLGRLG